MGLVHRVYQMENSPIELSVLAHLIQPEMADLYTYGKYPYRIECASAFDTARMADL